MDIRRFLKRKRCDDVAESDDVTKRPQSETEDDINVAGPSTRPDTAICTTDPSLPKVSRTEEKPVSKLMKRNKQLSFQQSWKDKNPWIRFDSVEQGMFCIFCEKEYASDGSVLKLTKGAWIKSPVSNWKKAIEKIQKHSSSTIHKDALAKHEAEKQTNLQGNVISQICQGSDNIKSQLKKQNRSLLKKLIQSLYYLLTNKIAHYTNFSSLIELIADIGDEQLKTHLESAPGNANYMSNMVIEEYIDALSIWIERRLLESLNKSQYLTIFADESTDISSVEEMAICFRWLDNGKVVEHFIGLVNVDRCDSQTLFDHLTTFMKDKGIDGEKLRSQGYDGAAAFSGSKTGVQARMRTVAPKALYTHCKAHKLQLACVSAAQKLPQMKKLFATLMCIWKTFHYSPKKFAMLKQMQTVYDQQQLKMIQPSDTRWLAHDKAVKAVKLSLKSLITTYQHIHVETGDPEALGISKIISSYNFVATLLLLSDVLPHVVIFSKTLQSKSADLSLVKSQLSSTLSVIQELLLHPQNGNNLSTLSATLVDLSITVPDPVNAWDTFQKNTLIPYLETLKDNIERRFEDSFEIVTAFGIFDPQNLPSDVKELKNYGNESLGKLVDFFGSETEVTFDGKKYSCMADVDADQTCVEWKSFKVTLYDEFRNITVKEMTEKFFLSDAKSMIYPNIANLLSLCMVYPVSTATVERSFSDMKQIKTRLRNRISPDTLSKLMLIAIEGPPSNEVDYESVIDIWKSHSTRRLLV